jgi:short-subunit dehydrogenase
MAARSLHGTTVLITGGARGIGRATALRFVQAGAQVVLADLDLAVAEATAAELRAGGGVAQAAFLDVRDAAAFDALVARIEAERGPLEILVNNAGVMSLGAFAAQSPANDALQLSVNLGGVIHGMRAALPRMQARGRGLVINVASMAGKIPVPHAAVYAATKHAVIGLTESVRLELRGTGVELAYVMPIPVRTELIAGITPMRWPPPVTPEAVAEAVVVDVAERGAVAAFVPASQAATSRLTALLPRAWAEWVGRALGLERLFTQVDLEARRAYLRRTFDRALEAPRPDDAERLASDDR